MENMRQKIAEIITHTHKTPLEQADEILLLFSVSGRSEQLVCGRHIKTCVFYKDGKCNNNDYCRDQVEQTN